MRIKQFLYEVFLYFIKARKEESIGYTDGGTKVYYVDIDETICVLPPDRDYSKAIPIMSRIEKLNSLVDEGYTIIYYTARGTLSGEDWYDLTKAQLLQWGAKHAHLRMGKPYFDLLIDNRAQNSENFFNDGLNIKENY